MRNNEMLRELEAARMYLDEMQVRARVAFCMGERGERTRGERATASVESRWYDCYCAKHVALSG